MTSLPPGPPGHTADGGVLVGRTEARRHVVAFEDPQCPYCKRFEESCGDLIRREISAGAISVEYRTRSFLGPESVRAANALALAAGTDRYDDLRRELFANQPPEQSGGFTADDLVQLGRRAGIVAEDFADGVRTGRYEAWVVAVDAAFEGQDPDGTPYVLIDGVAVDPRLLYDADAFGAALRA